MNFLFSLIILLSFSAISVAQQNLFNIPSGDITKEGEKFYQHQFNFYTDKIESKGHFVYGLGNGWDAGVNIVGKGAYYTDTWRFSYNSNSNKGSVYPNLLGSLQKQFKLHANLFINLGTQIGFNLSNKLEKKQLNNFNYSILTYHFGKGNKIVGGIYTGNQMFLGTGNNAGALLGYELKISKNIYFMGDWISGNNNESAMVLGGMYNISKRIQLCTGWLIPNKNNPKPQGIVFEVNILSWDL